MTTSEHKRIDASLGGVNTPRMDGDNLAIVLCSYFDNPDQPQEDETGWTADATAGCEEVLEAIRLHYEPLRPVDVQTKALATELVSQIEPKLKAYEECGDPEEQNALIDVLWGNKAHILHVLWMAANTARAPK